MRSKGEGINNPLPARRALLCLCTRGAPSSALPRGAQAQNLPPAPCCKPGSCIPWGQPAAPTTASSPRQALGKDGGAPPAAPQSRGKGRAHVVPGGLRGRRRWAGCWDGSHRVLLWAPQTPKGAGSSCGETQTRGVSPARLHLRAERGASPQPCLLLARPGFATAPGGLIRNKHDFHYQLKVN